MTQTPLEIVETRLGFKFYVRPESFDKGIVHEVVESSSQWNYAHLFQFQPDDILFDVGGHIGTFSCRFASQVKQVYAFEPDPTNALLFRKNLELNGIQNVMLNEVALIAGEDQTQTFYLNTKKLTAAHSFHVKNGREGITVQCRKFTDYVSEFKPTCVKLDTEGSEYPLFETLPDEYWSQFRQFVFEWHFGANKDGDHTKYAQIIERMKQVFPYVKAPEAGKGPWALCVACAHEDIFPSIEEVKEQRKQTRKKRSNAKESGEKTQDSV